MRTSYARGSKAMMTRTHHHQNLLRTQLRCYKFVPYQQSIARRNFVAMFLRRYVSTVVPPQNNVVRMQTDSNLVKRIPDLMFPTTTRCAPPYLSPSRAALNCCEPSADFAAFGPTDMVGATRNTHLPNHGGQTPGGQTHSFSLSG